MDDRTLPEFGDQRLPRRFWVKVEIDEAGCWLWTASLNRTGYGQFMDVDKVKRVAHRVAYAALIAPIPTGLQLDHLCRVRRCVNPGHVEPVTQTENLHRGETFTARNAAVTHCPQGHPYAGDNLYVPPKGGRYCRQCARENNARRLAKNPDLLRRQRRERDARYRARRNAQRALDRPYLTQETPPSAD